MPLIFPCYYTFPKRNKDENKLFIKIQYLSPEKKISRNKCAHYLLESMIQIFDALNGKLEKRRKRKKRSRNGAKFLKQRNLQKTKMERWDKEIKTKYKCIENDATWVQGKFEKE